jgi:hypothetical protein
MACKGLDIQVTPPFNIYKIEVVSIWDDRKILKEKLVKYKPGLRRDK